VNEQIQERQEITIDIFLFFALIYIIIFVSLEWYIDAELVHLYLSHSVQQWISGSQNLFFGVWNLEHQTNCSYAVHARSTKQLSLEGGVQNSESNHVGPALGPISLLFSPYTLSDFYALQTFNGPPIKHSIMMSSP